MIISIAFCDQLIKLWWSMRTCLLIITCSNLSTELVINNISFGDH